MARITWLPDAVFDVLDASDSLDEIMRKASEDELDWIVLERNVGVSLYYVFRRDELDIFVERSWDLIQVPAEEALELHEDEATRVTETGDQSESFDTGYLSITQPAMLRAVNLDNSGRPAMLGELHDWDGQVTPQFVDRFELLAAAAAPGLEETIDLGPVRGGDTVTDDLQETTSRDAEPAPTQVDAVLSADAPRAVGIGSDAMVDVRIELADQATPFANRIETQIGTQDTIFAIIMVQGNALQVSGPRSLRLAPPKAGSPSTDAFIVTGQAAGQARVIVTFRQGSSHLGTLEFQIAVSVSVPAAETVHGEAVANRRDEADDSVMVILIDERSEGRKVRYHYLVNAKALQWTYKEFRSDFVRAPSGRVAAPLRYVRSLYKRITQRVLHNRDDARLFARELQGIGTDMCAQLLAPEFVRGIWEHRSDIVGIQITSFEPFIPWEVVWLKHPDTGEVDDRTLGEYGLVRSLSGTSGPPSLRHDSWLYLRGEYDTLPQIGDEVSYLRDTLPQRHDIQATSVAADPNVLLDTLAEPDFDVLHIACHGETDLDDIELTRLILGDRRVGSRIDRLMVDPATIRSTAQLRSRRPLIFLNACESGQQSPSLTDWGGWPRAFWDAGAGAFVGTSWSVREQPAAEFAKSFYEALLGGATLSEAATAARTAAKALGDGSWLAFVIYGDPAARFA